MVILPSHKGRRPWLLSVKEDSRSWLQRMWLQEAWIYPTLIWYVICIQQCIDQMSSWFVEDSFELCVFYLYRSISNQPRDFWARDSTLCILFVQVVHYEIPNDPETFVHRSGRTGRAGKAGTAILMYSGNQTRTMRQIERDVGCRFDMVPPPSVDEVLIASSDQAKEVIRKVHPQLIETFLATAEKLLEENGPGALAAAIAHMSGFSQPPTSRSLITFEEVSPTICPPRLKDCIPVSVGGGVYAGAGF